MHSLLVTSLMLLLPLTIVKTMSEWVYPFNHNRSTKDCSMSGWTTTEYNTVKGWKEVNRKDNKEQANIPEHPSIQPQSMIQKQSVLIRNRETS